jgi:hypothetical protein
VIAVTLLALLLVAALLAGVVMTMLGHVAGGLALSGGSVLAAAIAAALAGITGMRRLRKLVSGRSFRLVPIWGPIPDDLRERPDLPGRRRMLGSRAQRPAHLGAVTHTGRIGAATALGPPGIGGNYPQCSIPVIKPHTVGSICIRIGRCD